MTRINYAQICGKWLQFLWLTLVYLPGTATAAAYPATADLNLNGIWRSGCSRYQLKPVPVPSICFDPTKILPDRVWYNRVVQLPQGHWRHAVLELKGARFRPEVFINSQSQGHKEGGMAPVFFELTGPAVKPGRRISLEIALSSLKQVPLTDASAIPLTDQWRSNISAGLWDDVIIHFFDGPAITQVYPETNTTLKKLDISYQLNADDVYYSGHVKLEILDHQGHVLIERIRTAARTRDTFRLNYQDKLKEWTPDHPALYRMRLSVLNTDGRLVNRYEAPLGLKMFRTADKKFMLNGDTCFLRGGTVVWHRWMRTEEGRQLGYDTAWFAKNIILRLKHLGANYLRFHLGKPPERLLDLCDRYGMIVQYEWSFFHGAPAALVSMEEQYRNWLDVAMRHPCISLIHPYNETQADQLGNVWAALNKVLKDFPPLVLEDRDVLHIHKYWWGTFENVGLYYDSEQQFDKTIMIDEFGANYLDTQGNIGKYPTVAEGYLRFMGKTQTASGRLAFQAESAARIAEYWRRIGAGGLAPFCALSSDEDGNNWFLGELKYGHPKPVWQALAAAFAPLSVSLDLWDKNFVPGEHISVPLYFFNDQKQPAVLKARLTITGQNGQPAFDTLTTVPLEPFSKCLNKVKLHLPDHVGQYTLKITLLNKQPAIHAEVASSWQINIFKALPPAPLNGKTLGIPDDELELRELLRGAGFKVARLNDQRADILITARKTWNRIANSDSATLNTLYRAIGQGKAVVMLDVGNRDLGQGYPKDSKELGPLQGAAKIADPKTISVPLFGGLQLQFREVPEPESSLHPTADNNALWRNVPENFTTFWNGMRGGLIVPAADMSIRGLSSGAVLSQWKTRGSSEDSIKSGHYFAYELHGCYVYSNVPNDSVAIRNLRRRVAFLAADAPSLSQAINSSSTVIITDLGAAYAASAANQAQKFTALACSGKNLLRSPVARIEFGKGRGKLVVSQLLTDKRLVRAFSEPGFYGTRYDEVAVQFVYNMLNAALNTDDHDR